MNETRRTRVAVLFGGRSTEHEISVITGLQVMDAFNAGKYEVIPVYIDPEGLWYTGEALRKRENYLLTEETKQQLTQVQLTSEVGSELIEVNPPKGFFSRRAPQRIGVEVFFPAFHGTYGEDGCLQGLLEFIDAPYVGSGPRAASIGMNKYTTKLLLSARGVPVLPDVLLEHRYWNPNEAHLTARMVREKLPLPVIVKPCNLGSSIAVSAAFDEQQLMVSLAGAFAFDHQVLVEPLLQKMYELNISVLYGKPPETSVIERPKREENVLTFDQKYLRGNKKVPTGAAGEGMASLQRELDPADVPDAVKQEVREYAQRAFRALDCRGVVRFDFMVEAETQRVYFNEVNTLPGSFSYYLWEKSEPRHSFTELLDILVQQAQEEWKLKRSIRRRVEARVLKRG